MFDFDRDAVNEKMPICGSCNNAKMLVWQSDTDLKGNIKNYAFKPFGLGKTPLVVVRCNWLKSPVDSPNSVFICDGWRGKEENA